MVLVIKTFSAEGFRGINKSLPLEFEDGVNVLFGDLGSGKSSVINAISWCLTGELAIEKLSDEFKREDGIVCKCHPKKRAEVKLKIIHGGKEISIGRTRERARSTTAGRSPLSVEIAGEPKPLQNEEAENFIEKVLGVSKYDFTRVYCLHQELIKGVVSDEPKERSRVIDKMLGTLEVRELIDALDVKRAISNKLKFLDSEIDSIRRDKIQFAVNLKKIVNEKKMELLNSGLSESQLTLQGIIGILAKIQDEITELAREYNLEIHKLEIEHELPKIRSILVSLDATVKNLDRALTDKISNIQGRKLRLESLLKDYNDAYAQLQTFGLPKLPSLDDAIKEFDLKNAQKNSLNNTMIELIKYKTLVNSCKEKIKDLDVAIKEIENKYGDEKNHVMLISKNDEVLKKIQQEFSNFSRLQKILSLSFEHLLELRPSRCPVCNQQIDYHAVTSFIKGQLQKDIVEKLNELKREEQKQQAIIWELKESLEKLKRIRSDLHSETVTLNKLLGEVSELLRQEVDANFNFDDKINELRSNVTSLHNEISSLETLIKCLKNLNEKEQQLRAEIVSDQTGSQLIKLAEENIHAMDVEQQNIINRGRVKVDEILGKLHCAEEILGYLDRENELANVEKQLPHLTKLIERKEAAKEELEEYGASLEAIRNAALEYEKEIVENELRSLSSYVNSYYQSIVNHPVFNEITLELEKLRARIEKTLTYSFKAVGNVGDIRLSTGLSNTQMNAAAVALFLATNGKIGTSLPLIIMDDPIQGFNSDYKLSLAKKIAELSGQRQIIIATSDKEFLDFLIESCSKIRIYEFLSCHEEGPIVKLIR